MARRMSSGMPMEGVIATLRSVYIDLRDAVNGVRGGVMEGEGKGCEGGRTGISVRGEGGRDWRCCCGVDVGSSDEFCRIAGYMFLEGATVL